MAPFKYSCFISYCHGQHDLVRAFLDQLKAGLKNELETLLDEEVYIDQERLKPGYLYDEALARAICQSACMVVVYSPRYERHEYCVRELQGMMRLEEKRREILSRVAAGAAIPASGSNESAAGCIIPIIFRGADAVPEWVKKSRHYSDFSRFTLATPDMTRNPDYVLEIQKVARAIYEYWQNFANSNPCEVCTNFELPTAPRVAAVGRPFPNREP